MSSPSITPDQHGDPRALPAAVALLVALSFTGLILFRVGTVAVSAFLLVFVGAAPVLLRRSWSGLRLFHAPVLAAVILCSAVFNARTTDWISVVYSMLFIATYFTLMNVQRWLPVEIFARVLKAIIVLYFCNVAIAQLLVFAGAPDDFLGVFSRYLDVLREDLGIRYFGFSSEPSYAGYVILTAFLALLTLPDQLVGNERLAYTGLTIYQVVAFGSAYSYLLALAIGVWLVYREVTRASFVALVVIALSIGVVKDYEGEGRLGTIASALYTGELDSVASLNEVDTSLFMRAAPVVLYLDSIDLDARTFVGHGPKSHELEYTEAFADWLEDDSVPFQPGFLPGFSYDFGLLGALVVLVVLARTISERFLSLELVFLGTLLFNANFNTQLFWFVCLVLGMTTAYARSARLTSRASGPQEGEPVGVG